MVEGLDRRLKESGGSEAEWSRLVRSLVVLGRAEDARDRVIQARAALGSDRAAIQRLEASARSLGIVVPSGMITGEVQRFVLPNLNALNFLLHGALGGGGTVSLKTDAQGKVFSTAMLRMIIDVPDAEARELGLPEPR